MKHSLVPFRFILVFFTFLLTVILYVDRACISTAKESIMYDLGLTVTQFGWVMAAFTLGYALFQAPSGYLADRRGPRMIITGIVTIWSLLTSFTGLAWNYLSMLIIRFFFGAGEAGAFPALAKVTFNWFPVKERGIIQGINFSGSRLGAALAMPLVAVMIGLLGWRQTFFVFGGIGITFALLWLLLFRDKPEYSRLLGESEKQFILKNRQESSFGKKASLSPSTLINSGNMWLAMIQYGCSNFTFYFTLTWMYPYILEKFRMENVETGLYASVPLLAGAAGNWLSGLMVDGIYRSGRFRLSRRLPAALGFILAAAGMFLVTRMETAEASVICMAIAIFGADMTLSPSWSFCIDIGREHAGTVSGTMNMAGNLGAFVTIIAYPYLFRWTGSNLPFFYICTVFSVLAMFLWMFMKPEKLIVDS